MNIYENLPADHSKETFEDMVSKPGVRLERIVSYGQSTPEGEWYDQNWDEWVMVVQGAAVLRLEDDSLIEMKPGDSVMLPAGQKHRVESTSESGPTIWLALHLGEQA